MSCLYGGHTRVHFKNTVDNTIIKTLKNHDFALPCEKSLCRSKKRCGEDARPLIDKIKASPLSVKPSAHNKVGTAPQCWAWGAEDASLLTASQHWGADSTLLRERFFLQRSRTLRGAFYFTARTKFRRLHQLATI